MRDIFRCVLNSALVLSSAIYGDSFYSVRNTHKHSLTIFREKLLFFSVVGWNKRETCIGGPMAKAIHFHWSVCVVYMHERRIAKRAEFIS